ncbi:MAG: TlpA family protein disulfide reductase [Bacteroidetes bacterium]|nr:TlpA family protein disulfide reductase [Bacteroidota bacterium]
MQNPLIQIGVAGIISWLVGKLVIKNKSIRKPIESAFTNGAVAYLIGLKVSLLFTHFNAISKEPMVLLYNWGHTLNWLMGLLLTIAYFMWFLWRKSEYRKEHTTYLLTSTGVFVWLFLMLGYFLKPAQNESIGNVAFLNEASMLNNENAVDLSTKKPIILNFWATWCPPCRAEMPDLQEFFIEYPEAQFYTVNNTASEKNGVDGVRNFMNKNQYTFPVILDYNNQLTNQFGVSAFPTTIVVNADGIVLNRQVGVVSKSWLSKQIATQ